MVKIGDYLLMCKNKQKHRASCSNAERFMAYKIVERLKEQKNEKYL